jgi:hypothetical protein
MLAIKKFGADDSSDTDADGSEPGETVGNRVVDDIYRCLRRFKKPILT